MKGHFKSLEEREKSSLEGNLKEESDLKEFRFIFIRDFDVFL